MLKFGDTFPGKIPIVQNGEIYTTVLFYKKTFTDYPFCVRFVIGKKSDWFKVAF